jgi:hypothetical protein
MDTGNFIEQRRSSRGAIANENRGANFVCPPTQPTQDFSRVGDIDRFADDFMAKRDQSVGCEHDSLRIFSRNRHPFPERVESGQLKQR